jgi:hypothetical protein
MRRGIIALAAALPLATAGCGGSEGGAATPVACLEGPESYLQALRDAPQEVLVGGETPIADCLPAEQAAGKIADVGAALVAAATDLNRSARREPLGEATVELGYLVGTVEARADATGGIHEDLTLRVESAALFLPTEQALPGGFQQRYEEGMAAGREAAG